LQKITFDLLEKTRPRNAKNARKSENKVAICYSKTGSILSDLPEKNISMQNWLNSPENPPEIGSPPLNHKYFLPA
jgi:hypothetical protein